MINSIEEAYQLLDSMNAPNRLKTHVRLVGEAAEILIQKCEDIGLNLDFNFIRMGVAIHDIGKIVHHQEMTGPGSNHEPEGERILLNKGVSPKLARVCLSHARWQEMECSTEELIIALADSLWKGRRAELLELEIIDRFARKLNLDRWEIFSELDLAFEDIASGGHERLERSISG
ncbi:HD domain-containing protein [Microbulbifer thermotolerans]|uniref:HD domain-containing protein n=1 Tax=Microbulbifer thermotolerans TaxID=252514 RepID=UPI00224AA161|nr:HD domain-containing protein [Microbulbifer thermotolerans]MCX2779953.1 HD domain-containing protein [Microbulbifer thermotolerans]MCX2805376.1 HD domain-containing protein [Microbulbifer thermotolerans]MCX2842852.1 HD domain-containing protein [Microbulbifer thermotolerans]